MNTSLLQSSPIVKKGLDIYLMNKKKRNYLKWGSINTLILSVMMYDIINKCPFANSNWYYIEYFVAGLFAFSVLYYFIKYLVLWLTFEPIKGTQAQRKLLHFDDGGMSIIHITHNFKHDFFLHFMHIWYFYRCIVCHTTAGKS